MSLDSIYTQILFAHRVREDQERENEDGAGPLTMRPLPAPVFADLVKSYKGQKSLAEDQKGECNWDGGRQWEGRILTGDEGLGIGA